MQNVVWRACILKEASPPTHPTNLHTHGVASILAPVANGKYVSSLKGIENVLKQGLRSKQTSYNQQNQYSFILAITDSSVFVYIILCTFQSVENVEPRGPNFRAWIWCIECKAWDRRPGRDLYKITEKTFPLNPPKEH